LLNIRTNVYEFNRNGFENVKFSIAENIVFKKRNVSFLAINALFRTKNYELEYDEPPFEKSYMIRNFVQVLPNDLLRQRAEMLTVVFRIDAHHNIIPITAFSEHDKS
jgi:hypothetical protein